MDWIPFVKENWAVISQAPWAFVTCAALFLGIGMAVQSWLHAGASSAKDERLALAESRVADYREKGEGRSPAEVAVLISRIEALEYKTLKPETVQSVYNSIERYRYGVEILLSVASQKLEPLHRQLVGVFNSAGWNVTERVTMSDPEGPHGDISLMVGENTVPEVTEAIRVAFAKADVEYDELPTRDVRSVPQIWISAGRALAPTP